MGKSTSIRTLAALFFYGETLFDTYKVFRISGSQTFLEAFETPKANGKRASSSS
jgi:hypothetical protein